MKSQTGFGAVFMGAIATLTIIVGVLIPASTVKLTEEKQIIFEQNYNKIQLILLNLLSSTHDNKKIYESVAENIAVKTNPPSLEFLNANLDKFAGKCYRLNTTTNVLIPEGKNCQLHYLVNTTIVLPYNPDKLIEEFKVGIG